MKSLHFCPEDVCNCRNSLNSCVLAFFFSFVCPFDCWLFSSGVVLYCWDSNRRRSNSCTIYVRIRFLEFESSDRCDVEDVGRAPARAALPWPYLYLYFKCMHEHPCKIIYWRNRWGYCRLHGHLIYSYYRDEVEKSIYFF